MNTQQILTSAWSWNPIVLLLCGAALAGYLAAFRFRVGGAQFAYFLGALAAVLLALVSPINTLADGYLFSAHMVQHILLLLIAPALLVCSLPASFSLPGVLKRAAHPFVGWLCGVGAMWLWHAPALCNAAGASRTVYTVQSVTLLAMGTIFWWQTLAPREEDRLSPLAAVVYLFTACTACSLLGMMLTFSPITVCTVYMHPVDRLGILSTLRDGWGITPERDQQIGGLLMWVPMCTIYVSAIFRQFARWYGAVAPAAPAPLAAVATRGDADAQVRRRT